jgi:hypothetical protein
VVLVHVTGERTLELLRLPMGFQHRHRLVVERDPSPRASRRRRAERGTPLGRHELLLHVEPASLEVEAAPGQAEYLAAAHPCHRGQPPESSKPLARDMFEEPAELPGRPRFRASGFATVRSAT